MKAYTNEWAKQNYGSFNIRKPKAWIERAKQYMDARGVKSYTDFICMLVDKEMQLHPIDQYLPDRGIMNIMGEETEEKGKGENLREEEKKEKEEKESIEKIKEQIKKEVRDEIIKEIMQGLKKLEG